MNNGASTINTMTAGVSNRPAGAPNMMGGAQPPTQQQQQVQQTSTPSNNGMAGISGVPAQPMTLQQQQHAQAQYQQQFLQQQPQQQQPYQQQQPMQQQKHQQQQQPMYQQQHQPQHQMVHQRQQPQPPQQQQASQQQSQQQQIPQQPQMPQQQQPPQQQQQQQQHIAHQGLNGGWQSDRDIQDRRKMIAKIVQLLQQRKPNAPQEWLKKLPQMAKRLEESLYRSAPSFQAYNDISTLKHRLQQLAMNIGMKTQQAKARAAAAAAAQQQQQATSAEQQKKQQQAQIQAQQQQAMLQQQRQKQQQQLQQQKQQQAMRQQQQVAQQQPQQSQSQQQPPQQNLTTLQQQQQQQQQPPRRMVNMSEINASLMPSAPQQQQAQQQQAQQPQLQRRQIQQPQLQQQGTGPGLNGISDGGMPQVAPSTFRPQSSLAGVGLVAKQQQVQPQPQQPQQQQQPYQSQFQQTQQPRIQQPQMQQPQLQQPQQPQQSFQQQQGVVQQVQHQPQQQQQQQQQASVASTNGSSAGQQQKSTSSSATGGTTVASSSRSSSGSDRQQVLRHQQQRLLLLRHAAKCPHEDSRCPVTPHCAGMKRLWKHIAECKDQKCMVPHCVSSRYVLSHYHRCKDVRCPVCGPVREAIHRSHEKAKQMQALKQRQEQSQQSQAQRQVVAQGQGQKAPGQVVQQQQPQQQPQQPQQPPPQQPQPPQQQSTAPPQPMQQQQQQPPLPSQQQQQQQGVQQTYQQAQPQQPQQPQQAQQPQQSYQQASNSSTPVLAPQPNATSGGLAPPATAVGATSTTTPTSKRRKTGGVVGKGTKQIPVVPLSHGPLPASSTTAMMPGGALAPKQGTATGMTPQKGPVQPQQQQQYPQPPYQSQQVNIKPTAPGKNTGATSQPTLLSQQSQQQQRPFQQQQQPQPQPQPQPTPYSQQQQQPLAQPPPHPSMSVPSAAQQPSSATVTPATTAGTSAPVSGMVHMKQQGQQPQQYQNVVKTPTGFAYSKPVQPGSAATATTATGTAAAAGTKPGAPVVSSGGVVVPTSSSGVPVNAQRQVPGAAPGGPRRTVVNGQVVMPKQVVNGPKPQEDHTLINCFTIEQIETHIASLNKGLQLPPAKLKVKCLEVLKVLMAHQHGWVFNSPVDPVELGLPDYFQVIKRPMDLGTIKKRLENGCYHSLDDFERDVHLTFDNAMLYNQEGSVVHNMAKEMKEKFAIDYEALIKLLVAEEDQKRKNGDACSLCGCEKLLFEPPVFYCNGLNCPSKRIRRNSYYYVAGNNQYHWCHQCFQELRDNAPLELADMTIQKTDLIKKKNDEVHEESWVQCDKCERWIHQICALFNTRQNKDQRSEYTCPTCTIEERRKKGITGATSTTPMAEDLPRTKLSEWLELHVRRKMKEKFEQMAKEKAEREKISIDEAKKGIGIGGDITIRQVTSMDRKLEVRERMKRRYAFKNYPDEFTFRCKCIVVFQNLDGVDVVLFGLYVYEHGPDNPAPNTRSVYVSYLDSVHYMRPRSMRTFIYHEILIAYLDQVRQKGFSTAHIWACPPLKGDDYILYAKPEDQKTPKDDRLRQWYIDMLVEAQKRGVVGKLTNMYDLYFANEKNDATIVPYMDGDYFPAEVENIIKDLEEGKDSKGGSSGKKSKKKGSKSKNKSGRGGTRSTGIDEEALAKSGILPPGVDAKSLQEGGRDYVMKKLGETIHPMKESFIVAYLNWKGAKDEDMVVPKEIMEAREKMGIVVPRREKTKTAEEGRKPEVAASQSQTGDKSEIATNEGGHFEDKKGASSAAAEAKNGKTTSAEVRTESSEKMEATNTEKAKCDGDPPTAGPMEVASTPKDSQTNAGSSAEPGQPNSSSKDAIASARDHSNSNDNGSTKENKGAEENKPEETKSGDKVQGAKKRSADGEIKPDSAASSLSGMVKDSQGRSVKVVDDDLEEMDCEFLNNRQAFLNLCQGNHYQFDQLRRAKHTSMMVLWHLHNRDAPKFVQQCAVCSREILTGYRYHCPTCADYDQCQECVSNPNTPRHPHQLKPIAVSGQQTQLTEAQRKERQRSIQLHMQLLQHAATCMSPKCPSANCTKMKGLLRHGATCQIKATGGCHVCKRIWALLQIHARQCKLKKCPVPNCMAIRERFRQLTKQQQAMDDRRRQEMNRHYRGGGR